MKARKRISAEDLIEWNSIPRMQPLIQDRVEMGNEANFPELLSFIGPGTRQKSHKKPLCVRCLLHRGPIFIALHPIKPPYFRLITLCSERPSSLSEIMIKSSIQSIFPLALTIWYKSGKISTRHVGIWEKEV